MPHDTLPPQGSNYQRFFRWMAAPAALCLLAILAVGASCAVSTPLSQQSDNPIIVASLETFGSDQNLGSTIDGSGSWSTEGSLTYDYDVDGDGSYEILNGENVETWIYPSAGEYTVILRVSDPAGNSATDTAMARPVNEGTSGDPDHPAVNGDPIAKLNIYWAEGGNEFRTLDASSSWAQDNSDLTYDYDIDGDGKYEILGGEQTVEYEYPGPGTYTTVLRVTDGSGKSATASVSETIEPADPDAWDPSDLSPVVKLQAYWADGGEASRTIDAQSSWARTGEDLTYDYDMNDDGTFEISNGKAVFVHTFPASGSYRIWLRVTDESGNSGTTSTLVEIGALSSGGGGTGGGETGSDGWDPGDLSPVVKLQAYWAEGGEASRTIDAQSSWARTGEDLTYDYDMNDDGTFEISNGKAVFVHTFPASGSYRIWLRVTDESGNSGTASTLVEIGALSSGGGGTGGGGSGSGGWDPDDLAPVVKLQAYWAEGELNRTIDAQSSWARTGEDLTYEYDMNDDGIFEISNGQAVFVHGFPAKGSYRIWLKVTDQSGNSGTTSTVVVI